MSSPGETQPERTALAWQRTGLGTMGVAGLLGHGAVHSERPALLVIAGTAALLGLAVLGALAPFRYRQVRRMVAAGTGAAAPRLVAAAASAVALVLIGLGTALAGYRRWRANEEAIRAGAPLPASWLLPTVSSAVAAVVVVVAVLVGIEVLNR